MKKNTGQSSLEFLMTYGWALLILTVIFIVAWQWGAFSIGSNVKPGAFGFWGLNPHDFVMQGNGEFSMSLLNTVGANITILEVNATDFGIDIECEDTVGSEITEDTNWLKIPIGDQGIVVCTFPDISPGDRYETFVKIRYNETRSGGQEFYSSGRIWGSAEGTSP